MQVAIVDYGMGNLGSLQAMAHRLGINPVLWSQGSLPGRSDFVILPGVGSLQHAMTELMARGLLDPLHSAHRQQVPILGICLGLQLLFDQGEEGGQGLGWFAGPIPLLAAKRTPHMGWNTVRSRTPSPYLESEAHVAYYFVHSYYVRPEDPDIILGETTYEGETFTSVVGQGSLVAAQFHPELSGDAGRRFIQHYIRAVL